MSIALFRSLRGLGCKHCITFPQVRTLLCGQRLGLDGYLDRRRIEEERSAEEQNQFRERVQKFVDGTERMAFAEELRRLLHVATADEQDQQLITKMMVKYHENWQTVRFTQFQFGPIVMRMYWHFNLPDKALEAFRRPELEGFFDQLASFALLLDLLYRHGRYGDLVETFAVVQDRRVSGAQFPRDCVILFLAACYQLNTPEVCQLVQQLMVRLEEVGSRLTPRAIALAAALMRRQGDQQRALRLLRDARYDKAVLLRDLQAVCLAELGRPAEAVQSLQKPLLTDLPPAMRSRAAVLADAVATVDEAVCKKNDAEVTALWRTVKDGLQSYGLISSKSLHEALTEPMSTKERPRYRDDLGAAFNRGQRPRRTVRRPGLTDMVD